MSAYEDPKGALRAMAYPDNHQGYGRVQLDQVCSSFFFKTLPGASRVLTPPSLPPSSPLQVVDTKGLYTLLAYGTQDPNDPRHRQLGKQGDTHEYKLRISNSTKSQPRSFKVTLVWTDRPGSATSCQKTRQSVLTNDLDLVITGPKGQVVYPMATAGAGPDR